MPLKNGLFFLGFGARLESVLIHSDFVIFDFGYFGVVSDMKKRENLGVLGLGFEWQLIFWLLILLAFSQQAAGLRPIREKTRSWSDEVCVFFHS